jgi:c-di-AMP phosphodiesterase-like protein
VNPFNLIAAPENIKFIFGFYWVLFLSLILVFLSFIATNKLISLAFLCLPAVIACTKMAFNKNKTKYKNNFLAVLIYSFFAFLLFELVKGIGFVNGLIQNTDA